VVLDLEDQLVGALSRHIGDGKVPGLVAAVGHGDDHFVTTLGSKSYGGDRIGRDSIFRIASMTKPVAAAACMSLVDQGKIRVDDSIDGFIPELSDRKVLRRLDGPLEETVPADRPIKVKDLLAFTLGFGIIFAPPGTYPVQKAIDALELGQGIPTPQVPPKPEEWVRRLATLPLLYQPGERWLYNTGADLLGILVARVSGQTFDSYLRDSLFSPMGMADTDFYVPPSKIKRFVDSYWTNPVSRTVEVYDLAEGGQWSIRPAFPSGAAGLVSTAEDYFQFASMLMEKGEYRGRRILSEESVSEMTRDQLTSEQKAASAFMPEFFKTTGWGFCMSVVTGNQRLKSVGTYGWDGGLGTTWLNDPAKDLCLILMTQRAMESPAAPPVYLDFWESAYKTIAE
jgi:CubicO group peptidase (beta-lactamase class C family)